MIEKRIWSSFVFILCSFALFAAPKSQAKTTDTKETQEEDTTKEEQKEEERMTLTVEDAVNYSLENSKSLQASAIDLEIAKRAKNNSWNTFLPKVTLSGTMYRTSDEPLSYKLQDQEFNSESDHWGSVADLSVGLNLSLAQIYSIRATRAKYESGEITWNQAVKKNNKDIREMFYAILLSQEQLKIEKDSLENARQRTTQAAKNYNNGLIPELSYLKTQVDYDAKKPTVLQLEQTVNQNLDTFAFLIGLPVGTKIVLEGEIKAEFKEVNADDLLSQYAQNSPEILSLKKQLDTLELNKKALDMGSFTPSLSLNYNYSPQLAYTFDDDGLMAEKDPYWKLNADGTYTRVAGTPGVKSGFLGPSDWDDSGKFSVTLAWVLSDMLPWSANRQQAKDVADNIRKVELSLAQLIDNTENEIRTKVDNLALARANIQTSKQRLNLAQRSYDMTLRSYRNGLTELLDLRDTENSLNQAKLAMASEQYNYITNLLELEYLINAKIF